MTVRVWMTPTELGEGGYTIDFDAMDYSVRVHGSMRYLVLLDKTEGVEVGRVEAGRWDAASVLEEQT